MDCEEQMTARLLHTMVLTSFAYLACCVDGDLEAVIIESDADGDVDSDADSDADGDAPTCDPEIYPCGPFGHRTCDVIADRRFTAANAFAEEMAGGDGIFSLGDVYADESVVGILLFGTAGWCPACALEAAELNRIYADFQDIDGAGHRLEFVAVVFEDDDYRPATREYARQYSDRYDFDFPTVSDNVGDILYYFDAQSTPGNILIDATTMRIQRVIQGWDESAITGVLHTLDGSVRCR